MNSFTFYHPVKNYFGEGVLEEALDKELKKVGTNIMLATYDLELMKKIGLFQRVEEVLEKNQKKMILFTDIMPNPTYKKVLEGIQLVKDNDVEMILAMGGGSVIDCCKVIAAGAKEDRDVWELKEEGYVFDKWIPVGVILTVSGTGAEQTNTSIITNEDKKIKGGLKAAYPSFAILDPKIVLTVPMKQVMSGAFDSLSHCLEIYFSLPGNDGVSDGIAETFMKQIIENMYKVKENSDDLDARGRLMWISGLAECGLLGAGKKVFAQCHMLEHQLAAYTDCNHGQGLAVIHPKYYQYVFKNNVAAVKKLAKNVLGIDGTDEEIIEKVLSYLNKFIMDVGLPTSFKEMGIEDINLEEIVDSCKLSETVFGKLTKKEALAILNECCK